MEKQELEQLQQKNVRGLRALEIGLALSALSFYILCMASVGALAGEPVSVRRRVSAAQLQPLKPEQDNGRYLKDVAGAPKVETSLNSQIFDTSISAEMTEKFNSFNRSYEVRQNYRLTDQSDYLKYQQFNRDLAEWTIKRLLQYHFENTVKNNVEQGAKRAARESNDKGVKAAAQAMVTISSVQKAISNSTFNLGQDTKTRFRYDFPSGVMRVGMTSPLLDATMDYRLRPADPVVGAVAQPEKLSVGVSRNFRFLNASTTARYGMVSETLNYGMNKHLAGPLSAQFDQIHGLRGATKDESIGRLNVGMNF